MIAFGEPVIKDWGATPTPLLSPVVQPFGSDGVLGNAGGGSIPDGEETGGGGSESSGGKSVTGSLEIGIVSGAASGSARMSASWASIAALIFSRVEANLSATNEPTSRALTCWVVLPSQSSMSSAIASAVG